MCICVCLHECMPCVCRCLWRPESMWGCLELKFQAVVTHLIWVLGSKFGFSIRTASTLNSWAIFLPVLIEGVLSPVRGMIFFSGQKVNFAPLCRRSWDEGWAWVHNHGFNAVHVWAPLVLISPKTCSIFWVELCLILFEVTLQSLRCKHKDCLQN